MSNNINPYDPIWYANEALIQLEKALGLAARVHRGYDKSPQQLGSTIQISRPGTFTAQDAPSTAQDLNPESLTITLNKWKEVKFALSDKELAYTGEKIINDHIRPAAVAIADQIDQDLAAEVTLNIPWYTDVTLASVGVADLTAARRTLFNNRVPMNDLHGMIDGFLEEKLLGLSAFTQHQGAGETGVQAQLRGTLGTKFGIEWFANQNTISKTSATIADVAGAFVGNHAAGVSTISFDGVTAAAQFAVGDILVITGHSTANPQQYVLTNAPLADGAGVVTGATIYPALKEAVVDNQVVTVVLNGGSGATKTQNIAFHRHVGALAMAPLPTMARELGAKVEAVVDPITGLAIRSRMFYIGDTSKVYVALDVLYGVKILNGNLGVRMRAA